MNDLSLSPPIWRVLLGLILAPLVVAIAISLVQPAYDGLESYFERVWHTAVLFWIVGGLLPAIFLGLPAYFILKRIVTPSALKCALTGAVLAALPWLLVSLGSLPESAYIDGGDTVINGQRTLHGWIELGKFLVALAAAGSLGGVTFWVIATFRFHVCKS